MYLQYFVGLKVFQRKAVFVPSLFVEIRRRMEEEVFAVFEQSIIRALETQKQRAKTKDVNDSGNDNEGESGRRPKEETEDETATHQGKIILDATVVKQAIRFPTDSVVQIIAELRKNLLGWKAHFGIAEIQSPQQDLEK